VEIVIDKAGTIRCLYKDELSELLDAGRATVRRASHVEPAEGGWTADMSPVGGPVLGPYRLRGEALAAEVRWLEAHNIPVPAGS
jgi:hypothetical protein